MELPGGKKPAGGGGGGGSSSAGNDKKPAAKAPPAAEAPPKSSGPPRKAPSAGSKVGNNKTSLATRLIKLLPKGTRHQPSTVVVQVFCVSSLQPSAGPSKKGKPTAAVSGKAKKGNDSKEVAETELSVSHTLIENLKPRCNYKRCNLT